MVAPNAPPPSSRDHCPGRTGGRTAAKNRHAREAAGHYGPGRWPAWRLKTLALLPAARGRCSSAGSRERARLASASGVSSRWRASSAPLRPQGVTRRSRRLQADYGRPYPSGHRPLAGLDYGGTRRLMRRPIWRGAVFASRGVAASTASALGTGTDWRTVTASSPPFQAGRIQPGATRREGCDAGTTITPENHSFPWVAPGITRGAMHIRPLLPRARSVQQRGGFRCDDPGGEDVAPAVIGWRRRNHTRARQIDRELSRTVDGTERSGALPASRWQGCWRPPGVVRRARRWAHGGVGYGRLAGRTSLAEVAQQHPRPAVAKPRFRTARRPSLDPCL